jgi:hypothetical protein
MKIEKIRTIDLHPSPFNPVGRTEMKKLRASSLFRSIRDMGQLIPIIVCPGNIVGSGNRRLACCKLLGIESMLCFRVTLSPEAVYQPETETPRRLMAAEQLEVYLTCPAALSEILRPSSTRRTLLRP